MNLKLQLSALQPPQPGYRRLKEALVHYRQVTRDGGWPKVPPGATIKPGTTDPRIQAVRARLDQPGAVDEDTAHYGLTLQNAIKDFQRRHGLEPDAVIGKDTLAALNQSAAEKARTIEVNMERWRWLPQSLGERHIRVNIAGFDLEAWQDGKPVSSQAVVVGRDYRRTPVFSGTMTYLVLNPSWEVPPSIAQNDLLPHIQKDPSYLSRMNFQVLQGWGAGEKVIDPAQLNWDALSPRNLNYRFRQLPGELNALGRVKLMFPNPHAIYLHDTPARNLFAKAERGFSSGCIRLEQPLELSAWALEGTSGWDRTRIDAQVKTGKTETVMLKKPVEVHLLYWTTWVNEDGEVNFRRDIYGRDARLNAALALPPPKTK
jgi:murein L,D-transpeptidase YcbB/YkuD